ncbi:MAG TPA: hypothetical protein VF006_20595 [Longimicrobium sp.]
MLHSTGAGHKYGASVLTTAGNIYEAGVYRSETRTLSLHAEHAALVHAAAHGEPEITAMAILSDKDPDGQAFTNPCGLCKQLLYETSLRTGRSISIVLANLGGNYRIVDLSEMIVYPWP